MSAKEMHELQADMRSLKARKLDEDEENWEAIFIWTKYTLASAPGGTERSNIETMEGAALAHLVKEAQKFSTPLVGPTPAPPAKGSDTSPSTPGSETGHPTLI